MSQLEQAPNSVLKTCTLLAAVSAAAWLVLAGPAYAIAGTTALEGLSYAAILCLVPGWIIVLVGAKFRSNHSQIAMVFLAGSTLRLLFVLIGTLVIRTVRPELGLREFFIWLLAFYFTTLATETMLVLKQKPASNAHLGESTLDASKRMN